MAGDLTECTAVVGLGRMGSAYVRHLVAAGTAVVAVDPDPDRRAHAERLRSAVVTDDLAILAGHRPAVVLLSLATEAALADVADRIGELADTTDRWVPIVVDTGTFSLPAKEAAERRLAAAGLTLLDCPVSGTSAQAEAGDVVVYASGPPEAVDACRATLGAFARAVHVVGPFGSGTTTKLLANLLVGVHTAAAAEALALADRAGLDAATALTLLTDGAGTSRKLEVRGPTMVTGEYGDAATVDLFRKDLAIIAAFAREAGAATPLLDLVTDLFERTSTTTALGDADLAAVHRLYLDDP